MPNFLLQLQDNGHYSEDTATIEFIIQDRNWFYPNDHIGIRDCHFKDLTPEICKGFIPVGSIEFVNKCLSFINKGPMKPINIPWKLNKYEFLKRRIEYVDTKDSIKELFSKWNVKELFVKSNSGIKVKTPEIYTKTDDIFDDTKYIVSEVVDLVSEYRVFVYRGKIRGMKHYLGDEWILPDKSFVEKCIKTLGDDIPAYTLDVGVFSNEETAVIEVHNFVSCGLYGFSDYCLIPMLFNGWVKEAKN